MGSEEIPVGIRLLDPTELVAAHSEASFAVAHERALPRVFETQTQLRPAQVRELDDYLSITRIRSSAPLRSFAGSVRVAALVARELCPGAPVSAVEREHLFAGFRELTDLCVRARTAPADGVPDRIELPEDASNLPGQPIDSSLLTTDELLQIWRRGHWMFFVLTQGLILVSKRLLSALAAGDTVLAERELRAAACLLWASGSAMRVTGSFTSSEYHRVVRPTMTDGHTLSLVKNMSLSGTMTWEHHFLVHRVWREELRPVLGALPERLVPAYESFLTAYRDGLSDGHRAVCARFGGEEMGSLVQPNVIAVASIESIDEKRLRQLELP